MPALQDYSLRMEICKRICYNKYNRETPSDDGRGERFIRIIIYRGENNMNDVWERIYKAYVFSFPLMIMDATMRVSTNTEEPDSSGKAPANRWMHAKELANASFRQVVTPNVDTIYSQIFIDLRKDALVLHKPAVSRYVMLQIMDAWSDTVAVLGTGGDTDDEKTYLLTAPGFLSNATENSLPSEGKVSPAIFSRSCMHQGIPLPIVCLY